MKKGIYAEIETKFKNELPRSKLRGIKNFSKKGNAASCGELNPRSFDSLRPLRINSAIDFLFEKV